MMLCWDDLGASIAVCCSCSLWVCPGHLRLRPDCVPQQEEHLAASCLLWEEPWKQVGFSTSQLCQSRWQQPLEDTSIARPSLGWLQWAHCVSSYLNNLHYCMNSQSLIGLAQGWVYTGNDKAEILLTVDLDSIHPYSTTDILCTLNMLNIVSKFLLMCRISHNLWCISKTIKFFNSIL